MFARLLALVALALFGASTSAYAAAAPLLPNPPSVRVNPDAEDGVGSGDLYFFLEGERGMRSATVQAESWPTGQPDEAHARLAPTSVNARGRRGYSKFQVPDIERWGEARTIRLTVKGCAGSKCRQRTWESDALSSPAVFGTTWRCGDPSLVPSSAGFCKDGSPWRLLDGGPRPSGVAAEGRYSGRINFGQRPEPEIQIAASVSGHHVVVAPSYYRAARRCNSQARGSFEPGVIGGTRWTKVSRDGRFAARETALVENEGVVQRFSWTVRGRFLAGGTARGTLRISASAGGIRCSPITVSWSAPLNANEPRDSTGGEEPGDDRRRDRERPR